MIPLALAAAAVPALFKGVKGIIQGFEADDVKRRDTTPAAFKEALALGRQAQAGGLPGAATALNRIEGGQNDTLSAATRAGTSGSSVLGLLEKADANRQQALTTLGTREDTYRQGQNQQLQRLLSEQAGYQLRDGQEYDRNKAALNQASDTNIFGALSDGAQVAAYGLGKTAATPSASSVTADGSGLSPIGPDAVPSPYDVDEYGRPRRYYGQGLGPAYSRLASGLN